MNRLGHLVEAHARSLGLLEYAVCRDRVKMNGFGGSPPGFGPPRSARPANDERRGMVAIRPGLRCPIRIRRYGLASPTRR
jgi:hypothetical protein